MTTQTEVENRRKSGILGLSSVTIFLTSLVLFGFMNSEFNFIQDFVSKLGARGEPNAIWWNFIGFGLVGIALFGFGVYYGRVLKDRLAGLMLAFFGIGFSFTAFPMDMAASTTPVSKAHIVAICLALAFWLFGLARMSQNTSNEKKIRARANFTAILVVAPMIGVAMGFLSMPITHRFVFLVVFGWTAITSIELLVMNKRHFAQSHQTPTSTTR